MSTDLPKRITRWTALRKARILSAIDHYGETVESICARYGLTPEELAEWRGKRDQHGVDGLKATKRFSETNQTASPSHRNYLAPLSPAMVNINSS